MPDLRSGLLRRIMGRPANFKIPLQATCPRGLSYREPYKRVRVAVAIAITCTLFLFLLPRRGAFKTALESVNYEEIRVNVLAIRDRAARNISYATSRSVAEDMTLAPNRHFVVNTAQCKIPNIDPLDPSIAAFVSKSSPVDCSSDFPNITFVKDKRIYINAPVIGRVLQQHSLENVHCCYRPFFRNLKPRSDNDVVFQSECILFQDGAKATHEFVKVECYNKAALFYVNFHAFVYPKKSYQHRFKELYKPEHPGYQYSVLIIGVDGVSRLNAHRQFPKTVGYLKERMGAVEMYGYTKVGDNTFPNLVPLLTGLTEKELAFGVWAEGEYLDSLPMLWKSFAANGYSTLYAEDNPTLSTFNYLKEGFLNQPTDYYLRPFLSTCERETGHRKPLNCYHCVGTQSETEIVLDWLRSYKELMLRWPSFAFVWINSATHDDFNGGSSVDHLYRSFLEKLHQGAYLQNTIVLFMSDHGFRWSPIRETYAGILEDRLPSLFISFPPTFRRHHPEIMRNVHVNARRLTTPFDLHTTLACLSNFDGKPRPLDLDDYPDHLHSAVLERALNLFGEVPYNRTCEEAAIDGHWCACRESVIEDPKSDAVARAASVLIDNINGFIASHRNRCASLKLASVKSARTYLRDLAGTTSLDYVLQVETAPGGAVFEATVRTYNNGKPAKLLGDVSRLNLYRGAADCMEIAHLKKFCSCITAHEKPSRLNSVNKS
ncbi:uncharacterized protein LOC119170288 [Rhipicephalus microplus]|uniref:uncharacterized protein LOC119170288 n=1 Tax=Rhipicephalus microplus TaxID=6941 RepID=UPI003F6D03AF